MLFEFSDFVSCHRRKESAVLLLTTTASLKTRIGLPSSFIPRSPLRHPALSQISVKELGVLGNAIYKV